MNNKGFTLIELMACVVILGFLSIIVYPSINNALTTNSSKSCKYYERSMISACKYFIQKENVDIKESNGGRFPPVMEVTLTELINSGYIEEYNDTKSEITNNPKIVINYDITTNTYTYTVHLRCMGKNGKQIYEK